ncbi:MAG: molecular chaperone Hsc20 [Wolbachia endosymbiont of Menacanthus eurysternus]|nr:MAG: molecular chaperone Hsc20 [Wolbachia endosymbiont of Menacanthus eurysternus]
MSNYFALFGIEPIFDISLDELEKRYIDLSKIDINEKQSQNMRNINKAYQVLKSPLRRAEHLLDLFHIKNDYKNQQNNDKFLIEIGGEYLSLHENLQFASKIINKKIEFCVKNLINAFAIKNFNEAIIQVSRLRYLYKLFEEIKKNVTNSNF